MCNGTVCISIKFIGLSINLNKRRNNNKNS